MTEKLPLPSVVAVPREVSPLNKVTVLPASAVPCITGVESFVKSVVVDIDGVLGAVVSIVNASDVEADEVFPAASVALTVSV